MSKLRKIDRGCYEHVASGRLLVRTSGWEGPRGGEHDVWEHGTLRPSEMFDRGYDIEVDGANHYPTRRAAVEALEPLAAST